MNWRKSLATLFVMLALSGCASMATDQVQAPVRPGARYVLAVDVPAAASVRTQLFKLAVERLPVGADAGIAEAAVLRVSCGHILRQVSPDPAGARTTDRD